MQGRCQSRAKEKEGYSLEMVLRRRRRPDRRVAPASKALSAAALLLLLLAFLCFLALSSLFDRHRSPRRSDHSSFPVRTLVEHLVNLAGFLSSKRLVLRQSILSWFPWYELNRVEEGAERSTFGPPRRPKISTGAAMPAVDSHVRRHLPPHGCFFLSLMKRQTNCRRFHSTAAGENTLPDRYLVIATSGGLNQQRTGVSARSSSSFLLLHLFS